MHYCVLILHCGGLEYAEVLFCQTQIPDEAAYQGSFKDCEKWATGFYDCD